MALTFNTSKHILLLLMTGLIFLFPASSYGEEWGKIMSATGKINIRADRSLQATINGQLEAGTQVRCDFLKDGWYAVFALGEKERYEYKARGYVYAPLLAEVPAPSSDKRLDRNAGAASGDMQTTTTPRTETPLTVRNIAVIFEPAEHEKVYIRFNNEVLPEIFMIEGKDPRVVIDIGNAISIPQKLTRIKVEGKLIRQIRSALDRTSRRLRIVVDLTPSTHYEVEPVYYKTDKLYVLDISEVAAVIKK